MAACSPHPANVPGDFYVEDGCCLICEVPLIEAPDLFGVVQEPEGFSHCYVKRQPETPAEVDQLVSAIRCAEAGCIRYRGSDRLVQLPLVDTGEGLVCDGLPADLQAEAERRAAERRRLADRQRRDRVRPWWRFW